MPKIKLGSMTEFEKRWKLMDFGLALLEKTKLARKISDGKNEIPHKFLGRKI